MITLKELVKYQEFSKESDSDLISRWFVENDMAQKGIEIISKISKLEIDKKSNRLEKIKADLSMYMGDYDLVKHFGKDIGITMASIIHNFIGGYDIEKEMPTSFKWLQNTVPTLELPKVFWKDFYEWLKEKGIYFKGEEK